MAKLRDVTRFKAAHDDAFLYIYGKVAATTIHAFLFAIRHKDAHQDFGHRPRNQSSETATPKLCHI